MSPSHHPQTRAALNLPGLCPVCGVAATRKVTVLDTSVRETYQCPVDGETEYRHGDVISIRVRAPTPLGGALEEHGAFLPLAALAEA